MERLHGSQVRKVDDSVGFQENWRVFPDPRLQELPDLTVAQIKKL
jgi:hypothetical protein